MAENPKQPRSKQRESHQLPCRDWTGVGRGGGEEHTILIQCERESLHLSQVMQANMLMDLYATREAEEHSPMQFAVVPGR